MEGLPDWFQYGDEPAFPASPANQYERSQAQSGGKGDGSHSPGYNMLVGQNPSTMALPTAHPAPYQDMYYNNAQSATGTVIGGTMLHPAGQTTVIAHHPYPALTKTPVPATQQEPMGATGTNVFKLLKHIDRLKSSLLQGGLQQAFSIVEELRCDVLKLNEECPVMGKKDYCSSNSSKEVGGVTSSSSSCDAKLKRQSQQPQEKKETKNVPITPTPKPCSHNNWDNVRARKGAVTLRCRTCQSQWRVMLQSARRCPHFDTGRCNKNEKCPKLHVYRSKQSLNERVQSFGDGILQRVPLHARPEVDALQKDDADSTEDGVPSDDARTEQEASETTVLPVAPVPPAGQSGPTIENL
eukprot:TRINITY_DN5615_c0_g1_i1.p1 TRINITY_DN5615_c0_g1~~TRINITY_DN5615_c0_g1_i1.p1  ORF type:complete len:354 (+),score=116.56 TRINITY_DN5615_c0_g1_i1:56-1117(+)